MLRGGAVASGTVHRPARADQRRECASARAQRRAVVSLSVILFRPSAFFLCCDYAVYRTPVSARAPAARALASHRARLLLRGLGGAHFDPAARSLAEPIKRDRRGSSRPADSRRRSNVARNGKLRNGRFPFPLSFASCRNISVFPSSFFSFSNARLSLDVRTIRVYR